MDDGDDHSAAASPSPRRHHRRLSLPNPNPSPPRPTPCPGGTCREDCWSDDATSALIDAWGERFLKLSGGRIKQKQWQEVADTVSSREDYTKPPKTDLQCKNRIGTLKKKYKIESTRIASGATSSSPWPFFHRLDLLIGSSTNPPSPPKAAPAPAPALAPASGLALARRPPSPCVSDSPAESSDGFPPEMANGRKPQGRGTQEVIDAIMRFGEVYERVESSKLRYAMEMEEHKLGFKQELTEQRMQFFMKTHMELFRNKHWGRVEKPQGSGMQEVIHAIMRFGEVYERVESSKLQHAMEMEKQKLGFERDLAEQRMQFFMKTHMELFRSKHRGRVGSSSSKRKRVSDGAGNNNVSNNHNNISSS